MKPRAGKVGQVSGAGRCGGKGWRWRETVPHGHVCQIGISCGFHLSRKCFVCQLTQCFLSTDFTGAGFLYLLYSCSFKLVTLFFLALLLLYLCSHHSAREIGLSSRTEVWGEASDRGSVSPQLTWSEGLFFGPAECLGSPAGLAEALPAFW